ncbi:hypothetical protein [Cardiobacterium hominis]|uniref:Uncharacterized protein n=1 Tax=Cardiobacterium hominis TaxID=2718 RepID=A0A1C3H4C3_9GAMM|nr:hypothetical protein [Cardiobacterium hominis]SAM64394.1 hypothetical protein CHUV0807_1231 [Cardiobacterium hominis]
MPIAGGKKQNFHQYAHFARQFPADYRIFADVRGKSMGNTIAA